MQYAKISGTGSYLPANRVSNDDLAQKVDTSDEWITARTGIKFRHIAAENEKTSDLAAEAARRALDAAGLDSGEIDLIIVATATPDMQFPSTATIVQQKLGIDNGCPAFDVQAVCAGFMYALTTANAYIKSGMAKNALVIGAETFSRIVDWNDRTTCVLFGDGAGAAVFGPVEEGYGIRSFDLGSDGSGGDALDIPSSGSLCPVTPETIEQRLNFVHMDGKAVFRFATKVMGKTVETSLERAGMQREELDYLDPHQANIRIIQASAKRLDMPMDKVIINIHRYGNMSAASIPVALAEAAHAQRFKKGDDIALAGFGAGLTWASCIMKWAKEENG